MQIKFVIEAGALQKELACRLTVAHSNGTCRNPAEACTLTTRLREPVTGPGNSGAAYVSAHGQKYNLEPRVFFIR